MPHPQPDELAASGRTADNVPPPELEAAPELTVVDRPAGTDDLVAAARDLAAGSDWSHRGLFDRNLVAVQAPALRRLGEVLEAMDDEAAELERTVVDRHRRELEAELEGGRIRRTIAPTDLRAWATVLEVERLGERLAALEGAVYAGQDAHPLLEARVRGIVQHLDGWLKQRPSSAGRPFDADELRAELGNVMLGLQSALDEVSA